MQMTLRPDFTSKLVNRLAFGISKFYIAPYDKINHELINLSYKCDMNSVLSVCFYIGPYLMFSTAFKYSLLTSQISYCSYARPAQPGQNSW